MGYPKVSLKNRNFFSTWYLPQITNVYFISYPTILQIFSYPTPPCCHTLQFLITFLTLPTLLISTLPYPLHAYPTLPYLTIHCTHTLPLQLFLIPIPVFSTQPFYPTLSPTNINAQKLETRKLLR